MLIRTLTAADADAYRSLRLRSLAEHPEGYAASEDEERERPATEIVRRIVPGRAQVTLGAFEGGTLVGMATLMRPARAKLRHRAHLVAMYVTREARGRGIGRALLEGCVETATAWGAEHVALGVTVGNATARALYLSAGFEPYGLEPAGLVVDGAPLDVEWMNLRLARG
jgi:GNAT superfamily N-acetyltransferase